MIVLKPFTTPNRRFPAGATVSAGDDFAPHSFAALKARGFIGEPEAPRATKSAPNPKAED
jgi:hypothetical protein